MTSRRWAYVALAAALALGGGAYAAAQPARPQTAAAGGPVHTLGTVPSLPVYPRIAADGSLGFDAVWMGSQALTTAHWSESTRSWAPAIPLSGQIPLQTISDVAGAPSGAAAAAWTVGSPGVAQAVQARYRPGASGPWEALSTVFSSRDASVYTVQIGMDRGGDAFAVWRTGTGAIDLSVHPANSSGWSPTSTVARDAHAGTYGVDGGPMLAVTPQGTVALVWEHFLRGAIHANLHDRLYVKVRPAGTTSWGPTLDLGAEEQVSGQDPGPPGTFFPGPRIAASASGSVLVTWQWPRGNNVYPRVAVLTPVRRWRRPRIVTIPRPGTDPIIAADAKGFATVLWDGAGPPNFSDGEADVSPRGRLLDSRVLGLGGIPEITADGAGDFAAIWDGGRYRPASRRSWCPELRLAGGAESSIAMGSNGVAMAVWRHGSDTARTDPMQARTVGPCRQ
jgi:hypothetical protein